MTRLSDLRKIKEVWEDEERVWEHILPATVADLVDALIEQGAEKVWTEIHMDASYGRACLQVVEPGSYLVFRLEDES